MSFSHSTIAHANHTELNLSGNLLSKDDAEELTYNFDRLLEGKESYFIINMENMEYLNSTGLNILIGLLTKVRNSGGEMIICNVPKKINQLLLVTKLNTVFNVAMSVDEANKIIENERKGNVSEQ